MDGLEATRRIRAASPRHGGRRLHVVRRGASGARSDRRGGLRVPPQGCRSSRPAPRPSGRLPGEKAPWRRGSRDCWPTGPRSPASPDSPRANARSCCFSPTGFANKQIARRLGISEKTVKGHLTNIFRAIGVNDRTQAALWAERQSSRRNRGCRVSRRDQSRVDSSPARADHGVMERPRVRRIRHAVAVGVRRGHVRRVGPRDGCVRGAGHRAGHRIVHRQHVVEARGPACGRKAQRDLPDHRRPVGHRWTIFLDDNGNRLLRTVEEGQQEGQPPGGGQHVEPPGQRRGERGARAIGRPAKSCIGSVTI